MQQPATEQNYQPRPYQGQLEADDGQWIRPAKDYASTRYSSLDQINASNAKDLKLAFTFSTGMTHGHEAAPLVVNNTMYIVTPFPNNLYALDLTKPGAPMKWVYEPVPTPASQGVACCDVVNRGAAYDDGKIYYNTLDDQTVAVDANTGQEVWKTRVGDINKGESMTMAPLVVKGKVLVGNSGGEFGVRGWLTALDAKTGKIVWRAYTAGPDKDVLIGSRFKPFYQQDRGQDLGVKTWPPDAWNIGGGGVWGWISYDPQLNLIYYGTANPGPWDADARPGDNKLTAGIFARDPDTGEAVWFYQFSPHDLYDYDGVNENILLDLPINGQTRKVLVHPDRNGYVYVIDRTNGEVLSASVFAPITTSRWRGPEHRRTPVRGRKTSRSRAKWFEALSRPRPAPKTGSLPLSPREPDCSTSRTINLCMDEEDLTPTTSPARLTLAPMSACMPRPGGYGGEFTAWDPVDGKVVWTITDHFPVWSGALATAGDVVFYGTLDGWFKAVDAKSGQLLWQFKTGSGIIGQPITYKGPDGKQYVAVFPELAAGLERSWPADWILAMSPRRWDSGRHERPCRNTPLREACCMFSLSLNFVGWFLCRWLSAVWPCCPGK